MSQIFTMSGDFQAVVPLKDAQWRRASYVASGGTHNRYRSSAKSDLVTQLPWHLVNLENQVKADPPNMDAISSTLRCIAKTIEEEFPYEVVHPFKTHTVLLELLNQPMSAEDISNILFILCSGYMSHPNGRNLLIESGVPTSLLAVLANGCDASCVKPLFIGLRYLILEVRDFKRHFIESGFISQIQNACEALQADLPVIETCRLIKSLMYRPIEDSWVDPVMNIVPTLLSFVVPDEPIRVRIVFQALRHLAVVRPETRDRLVEFGVLRVAIDLLLGGATTGVFESVLHFLAQFCRDGKCLREVVSEQLVNAVVERIHRLIEQQLQKDLNHVFVDMTSLLIQENELIEMLLGSQVYAFMTEVIARGSPWVVFIEASRIVGVIVQKRKVEFIASVYQNEVMFKAIDALLQVDDARMNMLGLDMVTTFFEVATATANGEWVEALKGQAWLRGDVEALVEDSASEDVQGAAGRVLEAVLSNE